MYTSDSEEQVISYYRGLEDQGWKVNNVETKEDGTTMVYMQHQYLITTIALTENEGITYIFLGMLTE
jgi:hypothetical protein